MRFVPKGWGFELWLDNNELYCGKQLFIKREKRLSLHYHKIKTETFYVHSGDAHITVYTDPDLDQFMTDWGMFESNKAANWENIPASLERPETFRLRKGDNFCIPIGMRHTVVASEDTLIYEISTQHFDEDSIRVIKGD